MGHQFTIEGDEAFALATELVALTGESLDDAVTAALRLRVDQERRRRENVARLEDVLAIAAEIRAHLKRPLPTSDMSEYYDENGLPV